MEIKEVGIFLTKGEYTMITERLDTGCRQMNDLRRVSVSTKRQITIPQKFYKQLKLGREVECILKDGELIIRPVREETEFAEEILADLIKRGLTGDELLCEFKRTRVAVRPAVERMIEEAKAQARKLQGNGDDEIKEIFTGKES